MLLLPDSLYQWQWNEVAFKQMKHKVTYTSLATGRQTYVHNTGFEVCIVTLSYLIKPDGFSTQSMREISTATHKKMAFCMKFSLHQAAAIQFVEKISNKTEIIL